MTYQLSKIRTRIEQKLDDTNFESAKLNQFINDGQRDILNSRRFIFMERETDLTTTSGSDEFTGLPTDMQIPLSMRTFTPVGYATLLNYVEYENIDRSLPNNSIAGTVAPLAWTIFNLVPRLVYKANDTYTIKLKYVKEPTELVNDTDVPEIPEAFSELLVLAGLKRAFEHNDDIDKSQLVQQNIDIMITQMDERYKRQSGMPHILRQPNRVR